MEQLFTFAIKRKIFEERNINLLLWPANYPDLNIIENVWSYDFRKFCEKGEQKNSFKEQEDNIYTVPNSIDPDYFKQRIASIPDRIARCLTMKRGPTNY